jgi:FkbM family methyltransferase
MTRWAVEFLAMLLRWLPWEGPRWRLIPVTLRWARSHLPADAVREVSTRHGFRMRVCLGDWLGRHVFVRGEYEPGTSLVVKALLQPGDTFVDVGANVGYFTLLGSRTVGPTGHVYAFEPVPATRSDLATNLRLNDATNVTVFEHALSNSPGQATFSVGPVDHRGTSSLRSLTNSTEQITVATARLDDLLSVQGKVSLIKIDVEGAELLVLEGMTTCLGRDRPDLIIEVTDPYLKALGHSATQLSTMLADLGYRMYLIDHKGLVPLGPTQAGDLSQYNALFTMREQLPEAIPVQKPLTGRETEPVSPR